MQELAIWVGAAARQEVVANLQPVFDPKFSVKQYVCATYSPTLLTVLAVQCARSIRDIVKPLQPRINSPTNKYRGTDVMNTDLAAYPGIVVPRRFTPGDTIMTETTVSASGA